MHRVYQTSITVSINSPGQRGGFFFGVMITVLERANKNSRPPDLPAGEGDVVESSRFVISSCHTHTIQDDGTLRYIFLILENR